VFPVVIPPTLSDTHSTILVVLSFVESIHAVAKWPFFIAPASRLTTPAEPKLKIESIKLVIPLLVVDASSPVIVIPPAELVMSIPSPSVNVAKTGSVVPSPIGI